MSKLSLGDYIVNSESYKNEVAGGFIYGNIMNIYLNFDRIEELFEEVDENNQSKAEKKVDEMCKKLLVNLIIEDYKINKIYLRFTF